MMKEETKQAILIPDLFYAIYFQFIKFHLFIVNSLESTKFSKIGLSILDYENWESKTIRYKWILEEL
jgi:hypothetical protein